MIEISTMKTDCRLFDGSKPCVWNKTNGYECTLCKQYHPRGKNILVIKLDAVGDVLRTTCIVPKIKEKYPDSYLTWITKKESLELLMSNPQIDEVWNCDTTETLSRLSTQRWNVVYSLDNTHEAASLATMAKSEEKNGYILTDKGITPTNNAAMYWLQIAVFDRLKKENTRSYQEIIYDICGFSNPFCKPCLYISEGYLQNAESMLAVHLPHYADTTPVISINTGSGRRWPKKMLSMERIIEVVNKLLVANSECSIVLLGGLDEVDKNTKIAARISSTRVANIGCDHSLMQFCAIIKKSRLLLCGDTLALHIAAGLGVPAIAVFGPTSFTEIYDYDGLIEKLRTNQLDCLCCYGNCDKKENCMTMLSSNFLVEKINKRLLLR